ncbi:MAG: type II toxin-antitoxin system PemK/MazF family toxin [Meiothermus sp.]|nr:type II toxin-antitoxin system PemK/MazF family toxin [Meiothermus sp.]
MQRGEVWWVDLPAPRGSESGYTRPALVVQSDLYTRSALRTVVVVLLTSNLALAAAPGNVFVQAGSSGLQRDSVVNVTQILTLDKRFFIERIGAVDAQTLELVESGIKRVLALR